MIWDALHAFGGLGLFLVGMLLLTEGLKALAGPEARALLARFTRTPLSGAVTGALTTAVVQSSSATTVTAVGFVAGGLMTFAQALGIIFGANIGTTVTGWLVAILGFKLDLGEAVLPLVFVGALLRLTGRARLADIGQALIGFSLLFIGIEVLKDGLAAFQGVVTPTDFPANTLIGRLELLGIGILITIVTQSSSAGVATALAALGAGAIDFPQAAAMVIGMDVGTTFTALLATIGGGTMARRTGLAHVIYNLMTGALAFFLLGPFAALAERLIADGNGQIALVGFHSFFNGLGVVLVLPLTRPFARMIEWLVPERGAPLTRGLDPALLGEPRIATELATAALERINTALCDHLRRTLGAPVPAEAPVHDRAALEAALIALRDYLDGIGLPSARDGTTVAVDSTFHAIDHLFRLLYRCDQTRRIAALRETPRLRRLRALLREAAHRQARAPDPVALEAWLDRLGALMRAQRTYPRDRTIEAAVTGRISDAHALAQLDALRWSHRVAYHLWRIRVHQNRVQAALTPLVSPAVQTGSEGAPAPVAVPTPPAEEARIDIAES